MEQVIRLRVTESEPDREVLHYVQYATEIPVAFVICDYALPADADARFYIRKPSGEEVYQLLDIDGNKCILHPTTQTFAERGQQRAQIQITADGKVLMSYLITCDIEPNLVTDIAVESKSEFSVLDGLIEDARAAIEEAGSATEEAKTAAQAAGKAKADADEAAQAATEATGQAKTATEEANSATQAAKDAAAQAKADADAAATEAREAATAADQAKAGADEAAKAANDAAAQVTDMIESGRGLMPEGGTEHEVLTSNADGAAVWSGDLILNTLSVAEVDMTITSEQYDALTTLLGGGNG